MKGNGANRENQIVLISGDKVGQIMKFKYLEEFLQKNGSFEEDIKYKIKRSFRYFVW